MIKHFCDGCSKELVRGQYATIEVYPKWRIVEDAPGFKYEVCDECYNRIKSIALPMPENTPLRDD